VCLKRGRIANASHHKTALDRFDVVGFVAG
jgi:hypothetical protein